LIAVQAANTSEKPSFLEQLISQSRQKAIKKLLHAGRFGCIQPVNVVNHQGDTFHRAKK
jgi:hypothetical protein